ncbi:hypothetical protein ACFUG9_34005 [Streptomyces griseoincarnatus]
MSRYKPRKARRRSTVITLVEGVGKGLQFEVDWPPERVEAARRSCVAGKPDVVALCIVLAFLQYLGAPCSAEDFTDPQVWPKDDVLTLFDMLGMPLSPGWGPAEDAELEQLLASAGGGRG